MSENAETILAGCTCALLGVFVFVGGLTLGEKMVRKEAVAAGLAEYRTVHPASQKTEFVWKARDNKDAPERP